VGDFLGVPPGTARSLIHRAREKLRPALRPLAQEVAPMLEHALERHRLGEEFSRRVIRGLETARWGAGEWENSPLGALAAALAAVGERVPYEFLMGVSGAAFRVQMFQPRWCPSAPHPRCGFDCLEAAFAALAYELVDLPVKPGDPGCVERVREEVVKSIDAGVPAFFTSLEESLIVGYEDEGRRLLLRLYGAPKEGYVPWRLVRGEAEGAETYPESFVLDWPHLSFGVLRRKPAPPDRRWSLVRSLELALELARTPTFGPYASGFAALEQWIAGLRDPARFENASAREADMYANAHCWYSLCDARSAAGPYLRGIALELGGRAAQRRPSPAPPRSTRRRACVCFGSAAPRRSPRCAGSSARTASGPSRSATRRRRSSSRWSASSAAPSTRSRRGSRPSTAPRAEAGGPSGRRRGTRRPRG
jgi:hypothetical protein